MLGCALRTMVPALSAGRERGLMFAPRLVLLAQHDEGAAR
jgi:hypothetical protein